MSEPVNGAAIMVRVQRCGRALEQWPPATLYALARELRVRLTGNGASLIVTGDERACRFLAPALRRHKVALLADACRCCAHELAASPDGLCQWCAPIVGRRVAYVADSEEERAFLAALGDRTTERARSTPGALAA